MNNKRKFLIPLAALAGAFVMSNASASVSGNDNELTQINVQSQSDKVVTTSNDVFKFILKSPSQSQVMAYHSSHSSHASHASHSSHQSGY